VLRKALLVVLLLLAGLYVAADFGAKALADAGVSKELQSSLQLSRRPDVSLGGFPFIPKLVSGRFDQVEASARGFRSNRVRFALVALSLHDVTFSALRVLRGADTTIGIGSGSGTAEMTASQVEQALQAAGLALTVRLADGRVTVRVPQLQAETTVALSIRKGKLLLRSSALPGAIRIPLPEVVPSIRYTAVSVRGARVVLSFRVSKTSLKIPG
jgi:LmeA-like phospholipid-binding